MSKWKIDENDKPGPIQVGKLNKALRRMDSEAHTRVTKSGVIGTPSEMEYVSASFMIGGSGPDESRPEVRTAQARIAERFAGTVSRSNVNTIIEAIDAELVALVAARPVVDERRTQEAEAESNALARQREQERNAKIASEHERFYLEYAEPGEPVAVDKGAGMAVVAQLCFDNSDPMSDYFDRHATLGPPLLLATMGKGAETEAAARYGLAKCPWLSALTFEWHTEKYSGGHGNYLIQKGGCEVPADICKTRMRQSGEGAPGRGHWEIQFWHGYPSGPLSVAKGVVLTAAPAGSCAGGSGIVRYNKEHGGIEVDFPAKPDQETIGTLKAYRFRWSPRSRVWYRKACSDALDVACRLAGTSNEDKARLSAEMNGSAPDAHDMREEDRMAEACGLS